MSLMRYQPWGLLGQIQDEMNKIFEQRMHDDNSDVATSAWKPHVDIKELPTAFQVTADLPGVEPDKIKVSLNKGVLTIEGERTEEKRTEESSYSRIERFSGKFCRQFTMPDNIDADNIKAKSKHGVLELTIPKIEKHQAKLIEVESD